MSDFDPNSLHIKVAALERRLQYRDSQLEGLNSRLSSSLHVIYRQRREVEALRMTIFEMNLKFGQKLEESRQEAVQIAVEEIHAEKMATQKKYEGLMLESIESIAEERDEVISIQPLHILNCNYICACLLNPLLLDRFSRLLVACSSAWLA